MSDDKNTSEDCGEVSEEEIELRKIVRGSGIRVDRAIDHRVPR